MSQWKYLACLLSFRSLCASYFFGQRRFGAALHRTEEFELEFLVLSWNTYLVIWSIEWPWTGQEYPLDSIIWWNGAWVNCSTASVGKFLWRQTAWSYRQASVRGLELYRNMCVCVCVCECVWCVWCVCVWCVFVCVVCVCCVCGVRVCVCLCVCVGGVCVGCVCVCVCGVVWCVCVYIVRVH